MSQTIIINMSGGVTTSVIGGAVAATLLSSPLGIAGGALCAGVGYLTGIGIQQLVLEPLNLRGLLGIATRIACIMAAIFLLAPLWGAHLTLLGSFIFSSTVFTIGYAVIRPALALIENTIRAEVDPMLVT